MAQNVPLTSANMALPSGAVLPSGESNFFDFDQHGKALNATYPLPTGFTQDSGVIITNPVDSDLVDDLVVGSGSRGSMLAPLELNTPFSNSDTVVSGQISDFTIFNAYIHYYRSNNAPVYINYSQQFEQAAGWDRYVDRAVASGEEDE